MYPVEQVHVYEIFFARSYWATASTSNNYLKHWANFMVKE